MAVIANSRVLVEAPSLTAPRYGLFAAANGPFTLPLHASGGGIEYETGLCLLPYGYAINCAEPGTKTFDESIDLVTGDPFAVVLAKQCTAVGMTPQRWARFLMEGLTAGEQAAVEAIFSDETFDQAPGLANAAGVVTLAAAANVVAGIGALEEWLADLYGPPGVIHIPAVAAHQVQSGGGLRWDGSRWRTALGNIVSFGNYKGLTPAGAAPAAGHTTFYITGQVHIWRAGSVFMTPYEEALNQATNQLFGYVEREYVVAYDCFVAGVDVTL
jgi:hypothetical protein